MQRRLSILLFLLMCTLMMAGCGKKKQEIPESSTAESATEKTSEDIAGLIESIAEDNGIDSGQVRDIADEIVPEIELLSHVPVTYHDNDLSFMFGSVSALLTQGIVVDVNTARSLPPGRMTTELHASYRDDEFELRIVNLSKKDAKIDNCFIAYCRFSGENTVFANGFVCGKTTRAEIEAYYGEPYYSTERQFVYKVSLSANIDLSATKDLTELFLNVNKYSRDMILTFDANGVLRSVSFASLEYMFRNLAANLGYSALLYILENLTTEDDGSEVVEQLETTRDEVVARLIEAFKRHGVEAYADTATGQIRIGEDVLFEHDKADIKLEAQKILKAISQAYTETIADPAIAEKISEIEIAGHASPVGKFEYNQKLSERRADAVKEYCLESVPEQNAALMDNLMQTTGYSYRFPIFDETGKVDMDASRRVEIQIHIKMEGD